MVALSPLTMPSFCGSRQPGQGAALRRRAAGGQVSMGMNRGGDSAASVGTAEGGGPAAAAADSSAHSSIQPPAPHHRAP